MRWTLHRRQLEFHCLLTSELRTVLTGQLLCRNARKIADKYCRRQAELGVGDCAGLQLIPGATRSGLQKVGSTACLSPSLLDRYCIEGALTGLAPAEPAEALGTAAA